MLLLLVLVKESDSGRGGDCSKRRARAVVSHGVDGLDDEFVLVWLLAENEEEERIKNLHQAGTILMGSTEECQKSQC